MVDAVIFTYCKISFVLSINKLYFLDRLGFNTFEEKRKDFH